MSAEKLAGDDARHMLREAANALADGDLRALRTIERNLAVHVLRALADGDDPRKLWDRGALANPQREAVKTMLRVATTATSWDAAYQLAADALHVEKRTIKEHWLAWREDVWPTPMPFPILKNKTGRKRNSTS